MARQREELRKCLNRYLAQDLSALGLQSRIYEPIKSGLDVELCEDEKKKFYREFSGVIDLYDPQLRPRSGFVGRVVDFMGAAFFGDIIVGDGQYVSFRETARL
jgi:hypothetical protein